MNNYDWSSLPPLIKANLEPIRVYMEGDISNLYLNRPGEIILEWWNGKRVNKNAPELSGVWLEGMVRVLSGYYGVEKLENQPMASLPLPGGHRMQVAMGDWVIGKHVCTIRFHRQQKLTISDFNWHKNDADLALQAIEKRKTILIAGATGVGKTALFNALLAHIPEHERIVIFEDVKELNPPQKNSVHLVATDPLRSNISTELPLRSSTALLNLCLRLNPDRVMMGEIRQGNALAFFRLIQTGHHGSIATIHANDADGAIDACLEYMLMQGDISAAAINFLQTQLRRNLDAVIIMEKGRVEFCSLQ
jgi:type IV secretion system protein VirB11